MQRPAAKKGGRIHPWGKAVMQRPAARHSAKADRVPTCAAQDMGKSALTCCNNMG